MPRARLVPGETRASLAVALTQAQLARLKAMSLRCGVSASFLVRKAVDEYFARIDRGEKPTL